FQATCRRNHFDLYHEPNFIPFESPVPTAVTIHDLSALLYPEWHPDDRVRFHEQQFRYGLPDWRHMFTVSHFIRRQIIKCLGVTPDRVTAVHNGIGIEYFTAGQEEGQQARRRYGLPPQFLLSVGTIEPRKNLLMLMKAYRALPDNIRSKCPLVLAGGWGWKS